MVKSGKKAREAGSLAESPSHLIHRALQLALDIYSREVGSDGLTQRQFAVLEAVSLRAGLTQTDLVKATGIDRSTLADLVARMAQRGLLSRERSTLDARAMAVRLTPEGEAALADARPRVVEADRQIMALLPKGRRESFLEILAELAGAADAAPEEAIAAARAEKKRLKELRKAEKAAQKAEKAASKKSGKKAGKAKGKDAAPVEPEAA
ncbi:MULTISPECIES: MarR family winged helix-turn-helix transcriptional regulator [unclassified Brevundimonas]|jgi:DNA-binding MarR family transcriptional regulator|uniref:MarR family winged helix-turn-helix transcriptional regulator n=1 Tax=unclassified Brevundimonas TaxID=2622653 RepID=UPI000C39101C|nr:MULTISPECIES: MarR family transcriptional regulator [unclassified Brevundimonas]MAL89450.1 MarR family transcriptional regulator [Brevundimonas sp.]HAJ04789.1 MarR family transcriptional regulator [Brevundimonas sp.]|tara:strand:+ start:18839 stop:19465 length:627 start_codon:yes stop_codon:yes gene_type:complete